MQRFETLSCPRGTGSAGARTAGLPGLRQSWLLRTRRSRWLESPAWTCSRGRVERVINFMMGSTSLFHVKMADYTIEPGQNLDLTDPDDPVVEEDGEVVREPEPADNDSDGGGGGSDPEADNDGGSSGSGGGDIDQPDTLFAQYRDDNVQYQDKDGDGIPDSQEASAVVTGGGDSGREQETVGTGFGADSEKEATADAATNPDFRAEKGTDIRRIQERLENVPEEDKTAVVVTEGPEGGQRVVGRGETRFQAQVDAARNQRFDAAPGTASDYIENLYSQGQGSGDTDFRDAFPRNQVQQQPQPETPRPQNQDVEFSPSPEETRVYDVNRNFGATENIYSGSRSDFQLPTPTQPESEAFRRDARGDKSDFFFLPGGTGEESLETSIQVQRAADEAGDFVAGIRDTTLSDFGITEENVEELTGVDNQATDFIGEIDEKEIVDYTPVNPQPDTSVTSSFVLFDEGLEATQEQEVDTLDILAATSPKIQSQEEKEKSAELAGAQVKDAGELVSLVPGAFGAASEIREDEDLTVTGSLIGGAAIWAEQARKNPSEFVTQEIGGELVGIGAPGTVIIPDSFSASTTPENVNVEVQESYLPDLPNAQGENLQQARIQQGVGVQNTGREVSEGRSVTAQSGTTSRSKSQQDALYARAEYEVGGNTFREDFIGKVGTESKATGTSKESSQNPFDQKESGFETEGAATVRLEQIGENNQIGGEGSEAPDTVIIDEIQGQGRSVENPLMVEATPEGQVTVGFEKQTSESGEIGNEDFTSMTQETGIRELDTGLERTSSQTVAQSDSGSSRSSSQNLKIDTQKTGPEAMKTEDFWQQFLTDSRSNPDDTDADITDTLQDIYGREEQPVEDSPLSVDISTETKDTQSSTTSSQSNENTRSYLRENYDGSGSGPANILKVEQPENTVSEPNPTSTIPDSEIMKQAVEEKIHDKDVESEDTITTVAVPDAQDEEAFRREEQAAQETEEMALFGSPVEPTKELSRGTVSDRLTEEVPQEQEDTFTGLSSAGLEQPSTTDQRPTPPGLDEVTSPEAVLTRATPETDTEDLVSGPQLFSTQETQTTQTEQQTGTTRPLDEDVLDVTRGQTPDFRLPFQHEEQIPVLQQRNTTDIDFRTTTEIIPETKLEIIPETRQDIIPETQEEPPTDEIVTPPPFDPTPTPTPTTTPDTGLRGESTDFDEMSDNFGTRGDQGVAAPDITSLFFGGGEENVGTESNPATGLERRAPDEEDEEEFPNAGLF